MPENLRNAMKLHFVDMMDQVLAIALEQALPVVEITAEQPTIASIGESDAPSAHQ